MWKVIYSKYSNERSKEFQIRTDICENEKEQRIVRKIPCTDASVQHLKKIKSNQSTLDQVFAGTNVRINRCKMENDQLLLEYLEGITLDNLMEKLLETGNTKGALALVHEYKNIILQSYVGVDKTYTKEFYEVFGHVCLPDNLVWVNNLDVDLIFSNIIVTNSLWNVIDYEWTFEFPIPINFLFYRATNCFVFGNVQRIQMIEKELYREFNISEEEIELYKKMEQTFQQYIKGDYISVGELLNNNFTESYISIPRVIDQEMVTTEVYWDDGNGFLGKNKMVKRFPQTKKINWTIKSPSNIKAARIDPMMGSGIVIIHNLIMETSDYEIMAQIESNGKCISDNLFLFDEDDAQLYIKNWSENTHRIRLTMSVIPVKRNNMVRISEKIDLLCTESRRNRQQSEYNQKRIDEYAVMTSTILEENAHLKKEIERVRLEYENSRSWKMTSWIRKGMAWVRQHHRIYLLAKAIKTLFIQGPGELKRKMNQFVIKRASGIDDFNVYISEARGICTDNEIMYRDIPLLDACNKKIAVHVHLYYVDLLDEFVYYLSNIPYAFDVFVSCQSMADVNVIQRHLGRIHNVKKVIVKECPNRGRDIAPLYVEFANEIRKYDYFLHVHSKKSLYTGQERIGWRRYSLNSLLGSQEIVKRIFSLLESNKEIGLVYPDNHPDVPTMAYSWLKNESGGRRLLNELNIPFTSGFFLYPAGSFFWAKTEALKPLFDRKLNLEDFPEEEGQTDGTLAHVIERCTGLVVKNGGFHDAILDYEEGIVRIDTSFKAFRNYSHQNADTLYETLKDYKTVSFDIFDTLVTRSLLEPDDVFHIMSAEIKEKYNLNIDFLKYRKLAEINAGVRCGVSTTIYDIYEELEKIEGFSHEFASELLEMELLLERRLIVPRRDMVNLFCKLVSHNKCVILVSDMYLPSTILEEILADCGISGYEELIVSCECGCRKDADTIWDYIFTKYNKESFVHVGDNPRSDWQTLIDRGIGVPWVMSSMDEMRFMGDTYLLKEKENNPRKSIEYGMIYNQGICNSPFNLNDKGTLRIKDPWTLGFSVFGPLFYGFAYWLNDTLPQDAKILFLSREGYILKQIYDIVCSSYQEEARESKYLLTSRRAASVASIQSWNDVREILERDYEGDVNSMLWNRLGIRTTLDYGKKNIRITNDDLSELDEVIEHMRKDVCVDFAQFEDERNCYLEYIEMVIPKKEWNKVVVVDVGYAGTIQYYLSKLMKQPVAGAYLASFGKTKPDSIGCHLDIMYPKQVEFNHVIFLTQLFLESALQAPCGQLIRFKKDSNNVNVPVYKSDGIVSASIAKLQDGILEYCRRRSNLQREYKIDEKYDYTIAEKIFQKYINGKYMSEELSSVFSVEDSYCKNKVLRFDSTTNSWK